MGALVGPVRSAVLALALLGVVMVAVLTLWADRAPSPVPASAPAQEFSAERALGPLREIASEPRPLGSAASDRTRDFLVDALRSAGFSVEVTSGIGATAVEGTALFGRVDNIVATLPGRDPTGSVILAAHYDSVAAGPGASDDGAAIAAMLETVRALGSADQLRNDLVLLITDGEEDGLLGAAAFVREHPLAQQGPAQRPAVVLNWEARGVSGPSLMFETSPNNAALVDLFADAAPHPHGDSWLVEAYRQLPNDSDFTHVLGAGLPGMNFAHVEGAAYYHTPGDTIANLDPASLQHQGANMLGLTRALGNIDLSTLAADHDAVYFRFLGSMVTYSEALVWPLALLAVAAVVAVVALGRRRRLLSIPRLLLGAASVVVALVAAGLLALGLLWVLLAVRPDYADNSFFYRPQFYQAALAALAVLAVTVWYLLLRRVVGPAALVGAGLGWLALLGVLAAWGVPGASHLFTLPTLGCAAGALLALWARSRPSWAVLALTIGVLPAVVVLMPSGARVFDSADGVLAPVAAVLLALVVLALLPVLELCFPPPTQPLGRRRTGLIPVTGMVVVLTLLGAGLIVDRSTAQQPRRTDLGYVLNTDTGEASWVSQDTEPAEWTRGYVTARTEPPVAGLSDGAVWAGRAPAIPLPAPEVTLRSRQGDTVEVHVSSPRSAPVVVLHLDHRVDQVVATAPGHPPAVLTLDGARPGRWPTEVRFGDLPPEGVVLTLRTPQQQGPLRISSYDQSYGLADVPGFRPRPPALERSARSTSDTVIVGRTWHSSPRCLLQRTSSGLPATPGANAVSQDRVSAAPPPARH